MEQSKSSPAKPGSLRSLLGRVVSLVLVRAELFSVEAQEHKAALIYNLGLATAAFGALLLGLLSTVLLIAVLTPPAWRVLVLAVIALGFILLALLALWRLKNRLENQGAPFSLTLGEVQKDWDALNS
jgi:uncharacterized membrane protein YqjE